MSSRAKKYSVSLTLTIWHDNVSLDLQEDGSLRSFHAAYLIHMQFVSNIFGGNKLSDLRTR